MGSLNNTISIVGYDFIISKDLIFFEINKWSLGVFSFRLTKLVLIVSTLSHWLVSILLKGYSPTPCCILIGKRSACFLVKSNTVRINAHFVDNDISISSSHELFSKFEIALKISISSLASLTFKI